MPANFIGREELGGNPHFRRRGPKRTAKDLPRRVLLYTAGLILALVVATLTITSHTDGWVELIPLAISCLGLVAIGNALYEPDRSARALLWVTCLLIAIGGCYGIYVHIDQNVDATRSIEPDASIFDAILDSVTETSPLIAPALLVVAAILAVFGSALDWSSEDDDAELDGRIAAALEQLDAEEAS